MSDERSVIKKTETGIDDLIDLWRRRKGVCITILITLIAPTVIATISIPHLMTQRNEARRERDDAQRQIEPFKTIALQKFSGLEAEALRKLAEHLTTVDADLKEAHSQLEDLQAKAELPRWRRVANIRPNGTAITWTGGARGDSGLQTVMDGASPIKKPLQQAFAHMNDQEYSTACQKLNAIVKMEPDWPYVYYYKGIATREADCFQKAVDRFSRIRRAGISEPELDLIASACLTFLGQFDEAKSCLDLVEQSSLAIDQIPVLAINATTPSALQERYRAIATKVKTTFSRIEIEKNGAAVER